MKILLHDYAGHPFQAELSRRLASRGHTVIHAFFAEDAGPKGRMTRQPEDPAGLQFAAVETGTDYSKTNFIKRRAGDIAYGKAIAALIERERPDIVLSGNTPTEAQEPLLKACRRAGSAFVFWCQDFYSIAAARLLQKKLPGPGHLVGAWYKYLDRRQMQSADHIILITDAFRRQTDAWGIPEDRISVIPNWGAIDEIALQDKKNRWAQEHGLTDKRVCLYTGTLALKHDPHMLEAIARSGKTEMVVVAFGVGKQTLEQRKLEAGLDQLHLLPLQPFERMSEVLGSADVLTAIIEREAGEFSVPSKVLSYLCAGRPIVLAAPRDNLAARILADSGAGTVVDPSDMDGFVAAAQAYLDNAELSEQAGRAGRAYANAHFNLDTVADRFETVIKKALGTRTLY